MKLTWYHGGKRPKLLDSLLTEDLPSNLKSGVLFVGEKGMLLADYDRHVLLPEKEFKGFVPPKPSIADSIGHHKEWIAAPARPAGTTTCNFDYSGAAHRNGAAGQRRLPRRPQARVGRREPARARIVRRPSQFLQHHYRQGWTL